MLDQMLEDLDHLFQVDHLGRVLDILVILHLLLDRQEELMMWLLKGGILKDEMCLNESYTGNTYVCINVLMLMFKF